MSILLIGLNHRTAPVEVREQLAFSREGVATALFLFRKQFPAAEAAIVSTCNRVEMLVASDDDRPTAADVTSFLAQARDVPVQTFAPCLYQYHDEQAVRHLFRVAASLDSMVVGEYQIVNQLKTAYAQASEQGAAGRTLNRLFHQAFCVGKRIRTETEIGRRKVSIPSVAVDVARGVFSDFANKNVLVVGAGDMAQLVCQHLRKADASRFVVASRTTVNAKALAQACRGRAVPYAELDEQLAQADIVITATSCPKPILTAPRVQQAQARRHGRPLFMIDLAVPRNVDPGVEKIPQVYVYDVDALGRIVAENQQHRESQLELCQQILDQEIEAFEGWLRESRAKPLIEQMFADARELCDMELSRLLRTCPDLTDAQRDAVAELAQRLINKFMHPCACTLRQHSLSEPSATLAQSLHAVILKHRDSEKRDDRPRLTRGRNSFAN